MVKFTKIQLQIPSSASDTCNLFDRTYTGFLRADLFQGKCEYLLVEMYVNLSEGVPEIYLASMEKQTFLVRDGIQTLDMLSLGFGPNKDRFSSCRPISISCALSIPTVRSSQHPLHALAPDLGLIPDQFNKLCSFTSGVLFFKSISWVCHHAHTHNAVICIGGSEVDFLPPMRESGVRFPVNAWLRALLLQKCVL